MSSLLRTRMIEDLRIRNYSERTVEIYVRCVCEFAKYFGRSPETLGQKEIREYQRFLVEEKKASWAFFNQSVCALRFLYTKTMHKGWLVQHIPFPKRETASCGFEHRRSVEAFREGSSLEAAHDSPNDVWSRFAVDGSAESTARRYRQRTDGDSNSPGQGSQRPLRDIIAKAAGNTARVLQRLPPKRQQLAVSES